MTTKPFKSTQDVDALAQEIRRVDGSHRLGAAALVDALMPFIAASAQADAWQPIETAPKDGTRILLGRPADGGDLKEAVCTPGYWQKGWADSSNEMGCGDGFVDSDHMEFVPPRSFGAKQYPTAGYQPTHWMPLPTGPGAAHALQDTPAAAVADAQPIDWPAVEKVIAEYIEDYEMVGEDATGREGYYTPTDGERALIKDAVHGLLAEDDVMRHLRGAPPAAPQSSGNPGPLAVVEHPDKLRMDAVAMECWDLRCFTMTDDDIGWRVVGHWMAKPQERVVAEVYKDDPRAAIDAAIAASKEGAAS